MTVRWRCENQGCYKDECIPNWAILGDPDHIFRTSPFTRGCTPSDIDGFVEIGGRFLYLEFKGVNLDTGEPIPVQMSQRIAAHRRVADGVSTFLFIWGDVKEETVTHFMVWDSQCESPMYECDKRMLHQYCKLWDKGYSVVDALSIMFGGESQIA